MLELPRGTVSFLFTDLEKSTRLWNAYPAAMPAAYARHDAILRQAIGRHGGVVYKVVGDAVQAAFPNASSAVAAALAAQRELTAEPWGACGLPEPLRVRMALHSGAVDPDASGDYRSPVLNRLGRMLAASHGGQILMSAALRELVWEVLPAGTELGDLGEHRLQDLEQPSRIYQLVHPEIPRLFPALRSGAASPNNLPAQPTDFLGRERETAAVQALLLQDGVRLVTLTGPGGTGKTRLSVHAAQRVLSDFADGVWFTELSAIDDPAQVPAAIAEVLGLHEMGASAPMDLLRRHLADKQTLLVIDNFEQVTEAAQFLSELLSACPRLKSLVTSRVPLHVRAEREFPVAPLSLPRRHPPPTLEQVTQFEAVRLFIARAQAVRPDFSVDNESAPAVAEICHRLDGLPLAIELAAARVRLLPPDAMLARLERRLPLLTGGARDLPDRQRTLRQTIAWSYDLLTADERALFRALSPFAGGVTIEAADAVAGAAGLDGLDVFDGLERLVDQSLLRRAEVDTGDLRFAMLETIREFGLEQLALDPDGEAALRRAHAAYFDELITATEAELSVGAAHLIARVAAERGNMRAALVWLLENGEAETAQRMTNGLSNYWILTGDQFSEGRSWLERALAAGSTTSAATRINALYALAIMAGLQGDVAAARAASHESMVLSRAEDNVYGTIGALFSLGIANIYDGRATEALQQANEAWDLVRVHSVEEWLPGVLLLVGVARHGCGDLQGARAALEDGLTQGRRLDHPGNEGHILEFLGVVTCDQGDLPSAASVLAESLAVHRRFGEGIGIPFSLVGLADVALLTGQPQTAAWILGAAAAHFDRIGNSPFPDLTVRAERVTAACREQLGDDAWRQATAHGRVLTVDEAIAGAMAFANELSLGGMATPA